MISVTIVVDNKPPWKQTPADDNERNRQKEQAEAFQEKAKEAFNGLPLSTPCAVSIRYSRNSGRADSGNIIGGILDKSQGIVFRNDRQVIQISYIEWPGEKDWYQVTITELTV